VGLFGDAALQIQGHLKSYAVDPRVWMEYEAMWLRRFSDVIKARQQLCALNPSNKHNRNQWPVAVKEVRGHWCQPTPQGKVIWWEEWCYPSQALLHRAIGFGLYGAGISQVPRWPLPKVDGTLIMVILTDADGAQSLIVTIPMNSDAWIEPRFIIDHAKKTAGSQLGPLPNVEKQAFMQDFRRVDPDTRQPIWRVCINTKMPLDEVQTLLVILAEKQGFPISKDEENCVDQWLRRAMRSAFRHWHLDRHALTQLVDELRITVHHRVLEKFDQPGTPWALRTFVRETTQSLAKGVFTQERRARAQPIEPESLTDSLTGEFLGRGYSSQYVAEHYGISVRTVQRWMKQHGSAMAENGQLIMTENQLEEFRRHWTVKHLPRLLESHGLTKAAAQKKAQRLKREELTFEQLVQKVREVHPRGSRKEG
jgi:hypothetical protein